MVIARLFDVQLEEMNVQQSVLNTDLPAGSIKLELGFNNYLISNCKAPKTGILSLSSFISIWEEDLIHAELLTTNYCPIIPTHMKVEYSRAYVWRITPKEKLPFVTFTCSLEPKQFFLETEVETGEDLFARSFSFGKGSIYIGTQDEEKLYYRAKMNDHLPKRYLEEKYLDLDTCGVVVSSNSGVEIHLPPLNPREVAQIHFIVSGGNDPTANWFAVDANPKDILFQAGCK